MKNVWTITRKEFRTYFDSPIAYIFITAYLLLVNFLYLWTFFVVGQADMRPFFGFMPFVFLFLVPSISMRQWAEERKMGTLEILLTTPVRETDVVLGKFLACMGLLAVMLLLTFNIPLLLTYLGDPDWGVIICGYLGCLLLGASYMAIGLFASSLSENQIVAFIIAIAICTMMLILGEWFFLMLVPDMLVPLFDYLGLGTHFESMGRGVVDSRDIVYYLSVVGVFLYLNVNAVENRSWV
ncbi:MAG: ABC transporter permease subunit [Candidatus Glassbacteria bacterium]|nr:ABC transporter permease subunit [Candidatus Glassbacteria bacterium]